MTVTVTGFQLEFDLEDLVLIFKGGGWLGTMNSDSNQLKELEELL